MKVISTFSGKHSFLSNFHPSRICIPNNEWAYPTVEHFFQAQKTPRHSITHTEIMNAKTPAEAKRLGRTFKLHQSWDDVKVGIMLAGLRCKFRIPHLRDDLLETEDAILIEGNDWGDTFWGQTKVLDSDRFERGEGHGLNMLGTLLMLVRQEIHGGFTVKIPKD